MVLVDPLLAVLGWDTADPGVVIAEFAASGGGRADYALLGPDGKPAACIEAKKLDEPLQQHRMQMLNYSNASGIKYAGLTDGNRWELYDVFSPAPLDERRLLELSIGERSPYECALELLLLWRPNLASGRLIAASKPILSSEVQAATPQADVPDVSSSGQRSISQKLGAEWVSLPDYDPPTGTAPPTEMRLPDGQIRALSHWYDILLHTTEWLWSRNRNTNQYIPVSSSAKRYLINVESVHPDGTPFRVSRAVPNTPLMLEAHRNAASCRSSTMKLLAEFGADPATVWLRIAG